MAMTLGAQPFIRLRLMEIHETRSEVTRARWIYTNLWARGAGKAARCKVRCFDSLRKVDNGKARVRIDVPVDPLMEHPRSQRKATHMPKHAKTISDFSRIPSSTWTESTSPRCSLLFVQHSFLTAEYVSCIFMPTLRTIGLSAQPIAPFLRGSKLKSRPARSHSNIADW